MTAKQISLFLLLIVLWVTSCGQRDVVQVTASQSSPTLALAPTLLLSPTQSPTPVQIALLPPPSQKYSLPTALPSTVKNGCISPVVRLAYPIGVPRGGSAQSSVSIPPPGPWQEITNLPAEGRIWSMALHNDHEIWLTLGAFDQILKYDTNSKEWEKYNAINEGKISLDYLFVSPDQTLWGTRENFNNKVGDPWLSKYNDKTGKFEFVKDQKGLLAYGKYTPDSFPPNIVFDQTGNLWMLARQQGYHPSVVSLISLDPISLIAEIHYLSITDPAAQLRALTVAPDGSIWTIQTYKQQRLLQYVQETHEVRSFRSFPELRFEDFGNENLGNSNFLFFDHSSHLWVDDRGWFEFTDIGPIWNQIIRSPVFITDQGLDDNIYTWSRPYAMYQSSDGTYWFQSDRGMVRLNPQSAEWCLFTNDSSPIVEDSQHNLWMVAFGKLYKLPLVP